MLLTTYKNRIIQAAPKTMIKESVASIADLLTKHVESGTISYEQLIKIHNLATNPEKLKTALKWL